MLKPIVKSSRKSIVHHPCDVLDAFCHCDATNRSWLEFDESLSHQLIELEYANRQYIRVQPQFNRRSTGTIS